MASGRRFLGESVTRALKPAEPLRCDLFSCGKHLVLFFKAKSRTIWFADLFAGVSVPPVLLRIFLLSPA
jgi:hypothetical protein